MAVILVVDASVFVAALQAGEPRHAEAVRFLAAVEAGGHEIHDPSVVLVEIACAVGRATRDQAKGELAMEAVRDLGCLQLVPLSADLAEHCARAGAEAKLRSGDALYAGLAQLLSAPLVTYDQEMRSRGRALATTQTPKEWLATAPHP